MRDRSALISPTGPRRLLLISALAAMLAVSACGGRAGTTAGASPAPSTRLPASAPASTPAPIISITPGGPALPREGAWRLLPPRPVPASAQFPVAVWTGREMLVHVITATASLRYHGVTYAYRPASGSWVTLAPGPAPQMSQNYDSAIWTGSEMIVFGLTNAAYNPVTNAWHRVPFAPGVVGAVRLWTGHQVIFWGGGCCGGVTARGAAYTPATNSWQLLPASPLAARTGVTGAWTGREIIIAGGWRPGGPGTPARTFSDAAAYNPATGTWRTLAPMPGPRAAATTVYDGHEVLFIGGSRTGAEASTGTGVAWNPVTGRWRQLPPIRYSRSGTVAAWTGRDVLIWGGLTGPYGGQAIPPHGEFYRPSADHWNALPMAPLHGRSDPVAVWTGTAMIVWGGWYYDAAARQTTHYTDGAIFTPGLG